MSADARPGDEVAQLQHHIEELQRELAAQREREVRWDLERRGRVRSTTRRVAQEHVLQLTRLYIDQFVGQAGGDALQHVIRAARELPDEPTPAEIARLKASAVNAQDVIDRAETAGHMHRRMTSEVARLRRYIVTAARELHIAEGGSSPDVPEDVGCICRGCRLVVGMDAFGLPEPGPTGAGHDDELENEWGSRA